MTKSYYTLAYPVLSDVDRDRIERFRRDYDIPFRDVVSAHFTLVFGMRSLPAIDYLAHVEAVASQTAPIKLACRCAMLGVDEEDDRGYVFLVPDQGLSDLSRLHDRLYTGVFAPSLRLDIPFIPHITVGTLPTLAEAKEQCDFWNSKPFCIGGRIDQLTVAELDNGHLTDIRHIPLAADF